jgi:tRNA(fMet)-specific endonuclease VapC
VKCLETNAVIAVINDRPAGVRRRLAQELASGEHIGISTVALFELIYGYEKSARREHNEAALRSLLALDIEPLPFELADAEHAGAIRAQLERAGTPIGHYDLLIAAQARRRGATLVTSNQREFARVPGLDVTDWATP